MQKVRTILAIFRIRSPNCNFSYSNILRALVGHIFSIQRCSESRFVYNNKTSDWTWCPKINGCKFRMWEKKSVKIIRTICRITILQPRRRCLTAHSVYMFPRIYVLLQPTWSTLRPSAIQHRTNYNINEHRIQFINIVNTPTLTQKRK